MHSKEAVVYPTWHLLNIEKYGIIYIIVYTNIPMKKSTASHFQHAVAGFVLASMYFTYMFVLLPNL